MRAPWLVLAVGAFILAACGPGEEGGTATGQEPAAQATSIDDGITTTSTPGGDYGAPSEASQFVDIYFVEGNGYATAVATAVPSAPDVVANAITVLISGPTPAQEATGLSSSVPTDTELLGIAVEDGLARVDLSREFESGGGTFAMTSRLAQVVYTLTAFATIDEVEFYLEGEPVTTFSAEGLLLDGPVARVDYLVALPLTPTVLETIELWGQADLPSVAGLADVRRVVLVGDDDVLNARIAPGVENVIVGMLAPGTVIGLTGPQVEVGSSTWFEVVTPAGAAWVNGHFLAEKIDDRVFLSDARVISLLDRMSEIISVRGDLGEVASSRGIYVSHHADPVRFTPDQLARVLSDSTTYKWPSNAINMDDPEAVAHGVPDRTFADAIGDSFASTWNDTDRVYAIDKALAGGNGRLPAAAIWPQLSGFHFLSVFDPGDEPQYGGLDWTSWHVSVDYEDGEPVVVALTLDQWAP